MDVRRGHSLPPPPPERFTVGPLSLSSSFVQENPLLDNITSIIATMKIIILKNILYAVFQFQSTSISVRICITRRKRYFRRSRDPKPETPTIRPTAKHFHIFMCWVVEFCKIPSKFSEFRSLMDMSPQRIKWLTVRKTIWHGTGQNDRVHRVHSSLNGQLNCSQTGQLNWKCWQIFWFAHSTEGCLPLLSKILLSLQKNNIAKTKYKQCNKVAPINNHIVKLIGPPWL